MTYDVAYKIAKKHSELPVIIDGPHMPTGKSALCDRLRAEGRTALKKIRGTSKSTIAGQMLTAKPTSCPAYMRKHN